MIIIHTNDYNLNTCLNHLIISQPIFCCIKQWRYTWSRIAVLTAAQYLQGNKTENRNFPSMVLKEESCLILITVVCGVSLVTLVNNRSLFHGSID